MSKPWVGYLSSVMLFLAGVLMIAGEKIFAGILFMILSIVGVIIKFYIHKKQGNEKE